MEYMARPSSYPRELRERAVGMVAESRVDYASEFEAIKSVASKLGIGSAETLRTWVRQAEIDGGFRRGGQGGGSGPLKGLKKEKPSCVEPTRSSRREAVARIGVCSRVLRAGRGWQRENNVCGLQLRRR